MVTRNERQKVRVERNPTKKGYMRLHTNLGDLNLELHCDLAPRTCENFFVLSEGGYYTDTIFHRSIKNFMIQVCLQPSPSFQSVNQSVSQLVSQSVGQSVSQSGCHTEDEPLTPIELKQLNKMFLQFAAVAYARTPSCVLQ